MIENLVSIITPMYKGAEFIGQTIESVLKQTYTNWEMIIVDDASPDNGSGISVVKKYTVLDPRIKLIKLVINKGSSGARNEALRNAKGRYLAFLDSDDLWDAEYLKNMVNIVLMNESTNISIFYSSYRRMNNTCTKEILPEYICYGRKDLNSLLFHCPIFPSAAIVDRKKMKEMVYFREELKNLRDDYVFWIDIMKQKTDALAVPKVLVSYRIREDSLTASKKKMIIPQWNIYRNILSLNFLVSLFYLCCWAVNGIKKYKYFSKRKT